MASRWAGKISFGHDLDDAYGQRLERGGYLACRLVKDPAGGCDR